MSTVRQIADEIVAREGGFVDDPDDPGGATKFGVTIHAMQRLGLDLDRDGAVTHRDVKVLTRAQAIDIFVDHYFERPRLELLPLAVQASVFDMYVNAGSQAVRILQNLLCQMGFEVTVDGVIGAQTARATNAAAKPKPQALTEAYGVARRNYYFRLADRRVSLRKYARTRAGGKGGWIKRAEEFLSPQYRLTDADFQRRISGWV